MIIYKTVNIVNNKFYVGKDKKNNPEYLGSGIILRHAISKYGRDSFKKKVLEHCENEVELNKREIFWIEKLNPPYNIAAGGTGGNTLKYASEERKKIKARKQSERMKGKVPHLFTEESRRKMSEAKLG
ncbi:hypothetical protein LCGC14_1277720, partial [marine sediment metagenome]